VLLEGPPPRLHSGCGCQARFLASRPHPSLASYQHLLKLVSASVGICGNLSEAALVQRTSYSERPSQSCGRGSPVSQPLASRRWLLRHQPIFHVCGNAKLFSLSDGFGSLQSGRQLFGLCQSPGCPGSPIVTIEIVARPWFHVIVLTVALWSLCSQPIASGFIGSALTCTSRIRPHLVHRRIQRSNPERAEVICWTSMRD
jgi:hypothetical protein